MCGKVTQATVWKEAVEYSGLIFGVGEDETVTPMRFASIIALDRGGVRKSVRMRWGLVPHWATDPAIGARMINARAESAAEKPAPTCAARVCNCKMAAGR